MVFPSPLNLTPAPHSISKSIQMAPAVSAVAVNAIRYASSAGGERKGVTPVASAGKVRELLVFCENTEL